MASADTEELRRTYWIANRSTFLPDRPTDSDRDYLLDVFVQVARLPEMARLYDLEHNPVWRHGISGDAARILPAFWRALDRDTDTLHEWHRVRVH